MPADVRHLRLIVRVPDYCQTGPDSYQDTTHLRTFVVAVAPDLAALLEQTPMRGVVIGAEAMPPEEPAHAG